MIFLSVDFLSTLSHTTNAEREREREERERGPMKYDIYIDSKPTNLNKYF